MKDIVLSVGSGKLIEHYGAKVFFYLTKYYLVRISFDQDNGIVREYVELEGTDYRGTIEADLHEIDGLKWEEIGANYFLDTDIWNIMCDSLFALLSGK